VICRPTTGTSNHGRASTTGTSRSSRPSSTSWRMAIAVNVLPIEPISNSVSGWIGRRAAGGEVGEPVGPDLWGPSRPVSPMARPGRPVSASSRFARRSISAMRATSIEAVVMRGILAVGTCRRPPASPAVPPVAPPRNPGIRTPFVLREVRGHPTPAGEPARPHPRSARRSPPLAGRTGPGHAARDRP